MQLGKHRAARCRMHSIIGDKARGRPSSSTRCPLSNATSFAVAISTARPNADSGASSTDGAGTAGRPKAVNHKVAEEEETSKQDEEDDIGRMMLENAPKVAVLEDSLPPYHLPPQQRQAQLLRACASQQHSRSSCSAAGELMEVARLLLSCTRWRRSES